MPAKLTHEFVKSQLELAGYKVLSQYVNSSTKIKVRCGRGHSRQILWGNFRNGDRCSICSGNTTEKLTNSYVFDQFAKHGYQLFSSYTNSKNEIDVICDLGHETKTTYHRFSQGHRCGVCGKLKRIEEIKKAAKKRKLDHEFVKNQFELAGYELLSQYHRSEEEMDFRCGKEHLGQISWKRFNHGNRCSTCHTENFYELFNNKITGKIIQSVRRELKRQSYSAHWTYFYSSDQIKAIADPIRVVYKNCPQGYAVDHIIPISWFNVLNENELTACWNPSNLRYLDAINNLKRGNKMTSEEIEYMRANHPEIIDTASRLILDKEVT